MPSAQGMLLIQSFATKLAEYTVLMAQSLSNMSCQHGLWVSIPKCTCSSLLSPCDDCCTASDRSFPLLLLNDRWVVTERNVVWGVAIHAQDFSGISVIARVRRFIVFNLSVVRSCCWSLECCGIDVLGSRKDLAPAGANSGEHRYDRPARFSFSAVRRHARRDAPQQEEPGVIKLRHVTSCVV